MYENLESKVTLRISNNDLATLKKLASKQRLSMSGYIRSHISNSLNDDK